jgi:hypothetical protein
MNLDANKAMKVALTWELFDNPFLPTIRWSYLTSNLNAIDLFINKRSYSTRNPNTRSLY